MIRRAPALAAVLTLAALTLTGCGGDDAPTETASPSASPTSASPSPTRSATPTETAATEAALVEQALSTYQRRAGVPREVLADVYRVVLQAHAALLHSQINE